MLRKLRNLLIMIFMLCIFFHSSKVNAEDSAISYIRVNNIANRDVEILITDKGDILVPFKQLAEIFQIQYEAPKAERKIEFITFDGKKGLITPDGIYVEGSLITEQKPKFVSQGMLEGIFNEAYIPSDVATSIMNAQIETDFETLTLVAQVDRDIPILKKNDIIDDSQGPYAHTNVVAPEKQGKFTLNTIGIRSNVQNDNMAIEYENSDMKSNNFMRTVQGSLQGTLLDGKYKVELNEYYSNSNKLTFGGLTASYRNKFTTKKNKKKYYYELGKVTGISDEDAQVGTQIFGAQIWNYDIEKPQPRNIDGYVKPTSLVRVTINNLEPVTISTYGGYYTLKDMKMPPFIAKIKLEEVNEDGTIEPIMQERYSIFGPNTPLENENRITAYAGIWGYQNRLFREGKNIYKGNNKKLTAGIEYQHGYKDNLTGKTKLTVDKIYSKSDSSIIYRGPTNDALLVSGTQKNAVYLEGATLMNSLDWKSMTHSGLRGHIAHGFSLSQDVREKTTKGGYSLRLVGEYDRDLTRYEEFVGKYTKNLLKPKGFNIRTEAFYNSTDFFIASSDSTSRSDRVGGKVGTGLSFNSTNIYGDYSRYYSNISRKYEGGTITFDEARVNASTRIPYVADLKASGNFKQGENHGGRNRNYNFDVHLSRSFGHWLKARVGRTENYYNTKYNAIGRGIRNYYSKHDTDYIQFDINIPKNLGYFSVGHDFVHYTTDNYKNDYNAYHFGYTFPTWKNLSLGFDFGFKYHGSDGYNFGINLAYHSKTGQTMSIGYKYMQNGGYFVDNYFTPTTNNHSINVTFNDAFLVNGFGLKSIGDPDINKGIFDAIVFIDVNKNGKYDKKIDKPMKDVLLSTSWSGSLKHTNRRGRVHSQSVESGVYTVSLNMDELPLTVSPVSVDNVSYLVKIDGGKTTKLEIPLLSTVGSVSGKLEVSDDFDRQLNLTDFIVVVIDSEGKEVAYSTLNDIGEFYITGLAPGTYTVKMDDSFVDMYALETLPGESEININIPYDYMTPCDITDIVLKYRVLN